MHPFAKAALGAAAAAYANHAIVKPAKIARLARSYANRVQKPMLTFVPPPGATVKSIFRERLSIGDLNLHPESKHALGGPGAIGRGSPYSIPVRPRTFACIFSCDTLEHLDRPDLALLEWHRVADRVFVIVPPWWTPEAWLAKWYIDPAVRRAWPLWVRQSRTIWLPSHHSRVYDARTCPTPPSLAPARRPTTPSPAPMMTRPSPSPQAAMSPPEVTGPASPSSDVTSLPIVNLLPAATETVTEADLQPMEESSDGPSNIPWMPDADSPSSTSVSSMMIVSGPEAEND